MSLEMLSVSTMYVKSNIKSWKDQTKVISIHAHWAYQLRTLTVHPVWMNLMISMTRQERMNSSVPFVCLQGFKLKMDDVGNILIKRISKGGVRVKNTNEESAVSNDILKLPAGLLESDKPFKVRPSVPLAKMQIHNYSLVSTGRPSNLAPRMNRHLLCQRLFKV